MYLSRKDIGQLSGISLDTTRRPQNVVQNDRKIDTTLKYLISRTIHSSKHPNS